MITPKILLKGTSDLKSFNFSFRERSSRFIDPLHEKRSLKLWKELLAYSAEKQVRLWDGVYYRLENIDDLSNGSKNIILSTVRYSTLQGYKRINDEEGLRPEQYSNHISTLGLIKTSDNYYVFGRRGKSINTGSVDFIGGGLLKSEAVVSSGKDIENNQFKEMLEEANIKRRDVIESAFIGVLLSSNMNVLFVFKIALSLTKEKLIEKFKSRKDKEMQDLVFIKGEDLKTFLKSQSGYRPFVWDLVGKTDY